MEEKIGFKNPEEKKTKFGFVDILLLILTVLPLIAGIMLKILFTPASDGIQIEGAMIYAEINMPFGTTMPITEAQINSWLVILSIMFLCIFLTHGMTVWGKGKRQIIAEWIVEKVDSLVKENMGEYFMGFAPFVAAILALSACSSLLSLIGLFPPTSDINITAGWAILTFILITHYKMKCGPLQYIKSFGEPVPFLAPLNIISEVATPVSMAFRHYGNVLSGSVISVLISALLAKLSAMVFAFLPGALAKVPFLRIGLPAVLSIYFDVFSGCLQAFIFAMLTMLYVAGGFPQELYMKKQEKKKLKKAKKAQRAD
ncbi:MAG: F0F1 ATP synthase subunit A [Oscillospiraceae bacterium]|nr:F0F1 ATP synthase subunit A [Oscillospiraceae bacterium]